MKVIKYFFLLTLLLAGTVAFLLFDDTRDNNPRYSHEIEDRIERVINNLQVKTKDSTVYLSESLSERLKNYNTPGVSIAVINDGKIEWARGFGKRNENPNDSVNANTLFMAGSVSKPVFALAVMHLKQKGVIDLDKNVNDYLKSWKVPPFEGRDPAVTLRELLSHTAGMTVGGFEGYLVGDSIPTIEQILNGQPPANSPPVFVDTLSGKILRYSGGGTTVAQLTIMNVLGKPFPLIMKEELFEPMKLTYSTFDQPLPKNMQVNFATGFPKNGVPIIGNFHVYPEMAAAGLWTTATELAEILVEVQKGLKGESKIFNRETIVEMLTPQKVAPIVGIGFFLDGNGDSTKFFHNGWDEGFVSAAIAYKELGKGAVVLINSNEGFDMLHEIVMAIAIEYNWLNFK